MRMKLAEALTEGDRILDPHGTGDTTVSTTVTAAVRRGRTIQVYATAPAQRIEYRPGDEIIVA